MLHYLITDGSVDPKSGIGFGAYLIILSKSDNLNTYRDRIKVKQFTKTSSTKLELQTLLWALSEIQAEEIVCYTDSQNIIRLLSRKEGLVKNNYHSKAGRLLTNHQLYKEFFEAVAKIEIEFHFIRGHKPSQSKNLTDKIFSLVDLTTRNALRCYMKEKF